MFSILGENVILKFHKNTNLKEKKYIMQSV